MTVFILIHGMWHGGWCWKKVTPLLRASGYEVYTPTLTGLGERSHLQNVEIDLEMHIQDVVSVFEFEDLHQVILVGHSLGGFIVNLDGIIPENGKAMKDMIGEIWDIFTKSAVETGNGLWIPPVADWTFGVFGTDVEWIKARLTPHPLKPLTAPVNLRNLSVLCTIPSTFILCAKGRSIKDIAIDAANPTNSGYKYRTLY